MWHGCTDQGVTRRGVHRGTEISEDTVSDLDSGTTNHEHVLSVDYWVHVNYVKEPKFRQFPTSYVHSTSVLYTKQRSDNVKRLLEVYFKPIQLHLGHCWKHI